MSFTFILKKRKKEKSGFFLWFNSVTNIPPSIIQSSCENVVTVIERFEDCTFVCGTNGEEPMCWKLVRNNNISKIIFRSA